LFYIRTKSVTKNVRGFIKRLPKTAQKMLECRMLLSEQWLRTIAVMHSFAAGNLYQQCKVRFASETL